jgi:3-hydroxyisobutyrate dehydrogenase-like beta-hydroxyacid dehydrogenase
MSEKRTIALLHPGEMGAAVGACLIQHQVLWASEGRSTATRARAKAAGLEDAGTLERALQFADIVLSVCPPHAATALAREVAGRKFRGIFVDCNAIAPDTAREAARIVEEAGATFVDGGIVGPPPTQSGKSRIYVCGAGSGDIAALFAGTNMEAVPLDGPVGAASAVKACYAAWTKGATALLAAIRTLARHEGVDATLLEEWKRSQPELPKRSEAVTGAARKAWRWIGEMEEIAASFRAAGLPDGFHLAAAQIYRELEQFKDPGAPPSMDEVTATLRRIK